MSPTIDLNRALLRDMHGLQRTQDNFQRPARSTLDQAPSDNQFGQDEVFFYAPHNNMNSSRRGHPISVPHNGMPPRNLRNASTINPISRSVTSQTVLSPTSGRPQIVGNPVADRTVSNMIYGNNKSFRHLKFNKKPRLDEEQHIPEAGMSSTPSLFHSGTRQSVPVLGKSQATVIDLQEDSDIEMGEDPNSTSDPIDFLRRHRPLEDGLSAPSKFTRSTRNSGKNPFRAADDPFEGTSKRFQPEQHTTKNNSLPSPNGSNSRVVDCEVIDVDAPAPSFASSSESTVRRMTRHYESMEKKKLANCSSLLGYNGKGADSPGPINASARKGKMARMKPKGTPSSSQSKAASTCNQTRLQFTSVAGPSSNNNTSKYFDNSNERESFSKETARIDMKVSVNVAEWINSRTHRRGKDATLHLTETQVMLEANDDFIERFPYKDISSIELSSAGNDSDFWVANFPHLDLAVKIVEPEKNYKAFREMMRKALIGKRQQNDRNSHHIENLDSSGTKALWEARVQNATIPPTEGLDMDENLYPNVPIRLDSPEASGPVASSSNANTPPPRTRSKREQRERRRETTPTSVIVRRNSSRQLRSSNVPPPPSEPPVDPDQIILIYPPSGTGALNITNGLLKRLKPGEFFNDTLIEFGLKLWLQGLRETNPTMADKVHVFSSFFYKKLKGKGTQDGYQSVRKWTSKFDFFEKDYIIVPINENVHWYLAIICHPRLALKKPLPQKVPTRGSPRRKKKALRSPSLDARNSVEISPDSIPTPDAAPPKANEPSNFYRRLTKVPSSPEALEHEVELVTESTQQVSLEDVETGLLRGDRRSEVSPELGYPTNLPEVEPPEPVSAASTPLVDLEEPIDDSNETPHIFTLDSMGSNHPQAHKILQQYLIAEAKDKKGLTETRAATKRKIQVPSQPNFCDCGVYLLHFVRVFLKEPEISYLRMREGKLSKEEMNQTWSAETIPGLREELLGTIFKLSEEWKSSTARGTKRPSDATDEDRGQASDREVEGLLDAPSAERVSVVPASEDDNPILVDRASPGTASHD